MQTLLIRTIMFNFFLKKIFLKEREWIRFFIFVFLSFFSFFCFLKKKMINLFFFFIQFFLLLKKGLSYFDKFRLKHTRWSGTLSKSGGAYVKWLLVIYQKDKVREVLHF